MTSRDLFIALWVGVVAFWLTWLPRELVLIPMSAERINSLTIDKPVWTVLSLAIGVSVAALVAAVRWHD